MVTDLWDRVLATTAPPEPWVLGLVAAVALVLAWTGPGYRLVRHVVTLIHESGHALVAVLVGRRLSGVRLHADTSGVTLSRGAPTGPGMIATLAAGYPAPALIGLLGAWLLSLGHAAAVLWGLVVLCAALLLLIRNLYGLWVVLATGVAVGALSWWAPDPVLSAAGHLVVLSLLLAAPRSVVEMQRQRRSRRRPAGSPNSDADQLARLTHTPVLLWTGLFWLVCAACLVGGVWLLAGPVLRLLTGTD